MFGLYNFDPNRRKSNRTIMAKIATLKIYGDIGEPAPVDMFTEPVEIISAKSVSEFLEANKDATEIVVRIDSRGGDVQTGWTIYDLLTTSGKTITTIGEGKIYSIATIIFMAGSVRKMLKNADGLIHNPYIPEYTLAGAYESNDLLKLAEDLGNEEAKILDFYAEKTGYDKAILATYMKNETKLSANDMMQLGFATEIVEPVKAFAIYKQLNVNKMATEQEKTKIMERFDALMTGDFAKAFSRIKTDAKNMSLTDKSGNVLTVETEGGPAVGDTASPDGTFVMENGDTYVVVAGKIESITPATDAPNAELDAANAKIKELTDQLAAANAAKTTAEAAKVDADKAIADFKAKETEMVAFVTELKAIKNAWKPETRSTSETANKVDGIDINRAKEIAKKIKK